MIRPIGASGLAAFTAYLADQLSDNGRNGRPLFQPSSPSLAFPVEEKVAAFRNAMAIPIGDPNWRRIWGAFDDGNCIVGHVDLRSHEEPCTRHRAALGMGVHRDHRGQGLGRRLLAFAIEWALSETRLEWIDLSVPGENMPARSLYEKAGFQILATIQDMYRVDGISVADVIMTKRLRG